MTRYAPVNTKRDFAKRYANGEFGNRTRTWTSIKSMLEDSPPHHSSLYHIRNKVAGGVTFYDVPGEDLCDKWEAVMMSGYNPTDFYISEMAPTDKTLFQGEIYYEGGEMCIFGSRAKMTMREALKDSGKTYRGLEALSTLRVFCDHWSSLHIDHLINCYPGHVIEFSTYSQRCGTEMLNTVIWEVRNY